MSVLFISYSHQDERLKDQLLRQLRVLEHERLFEIWIDDRIPTGIEWEAAINDALLQADIAILLVTSNFLTSNFILSNEIPALLKRRKAGAVSLFPIIGKPCAWQEVTWLAELNVLPKNGEPIWGKDNKTAERYLAEITREIAKVTKNSHRAESNTLLDRNFYQSLSSHLPTTPQEIRTIVSQAISDGGKAYDNGDKRGCFETYQHTARRLLTQLLVKQSEIDVSGIRINDMEYFRMSEGLFSKMGFPLTFTKNKKESDQILFRAIIIDLRMTLEKIDDMNNLDVASAAWALRYCFDRVLLLLSDK